ncbi:MAG: hypothetical protein D3906_04570, partial [Candidatus Electrothrix sp. AUS1_2]|nr:hypothetical protein [Candidatus Electrothrix sp. AUS1_2]
MPYSYDKSKFYSENTVRSLNISHVRFPLTVWLTFGGAGFFTLLSKNPLLGIGALGTLPILLQLTWRAGESPVLFFAVFFQWLQVSISVFHANLIGKDIAAYPNAASTATAVWLGLAGLLVLAAGMKIGVSRNDRHSSLSGRLPQFRYSEKKVWFLYLFFFILSVALPAFLWKVPQVRTGVLAILSLKWSFFYIVAYNSFSSGTGLRNPYLLL